MQYKINEDKILIPIRKWEKRPFNENMLYSEFPISKYIDDPVTESIINGKINKDINSFGYRCDEFINLHDKKHIVFAGCSVTWGIGLNLNEIWSYKIYEKINNQYGCSGYFNLAFPGSSIQTQIISLFKYFKKFGNPDVVFINFPDIYRYYNYSIKNNKIIDALYDYNSEKILSLISYQYYFMLDEYCRTNKIKLFSFTWFKKDLEIDGESLTGNGLEKHPFDNFNFFYKINENDLYNYVFDKIKNNKDNKYMEFARDGEHYGIAYHDYWADFIYNKYLESL